MIVTESDVLTAALDRRLQVDRIVRPTAAFANDADGPRAGAQPSLVAARPAAAPLQFLLGQLLDAHVVEGDPAGQLIVEIANTRLALAWPGALPDAGSRVALRVLANQPALVFEHVPEDRPSQADTPTRLSVAARALQARGETASEIARFTAPILKIEVATAHGDTVLADPPVAARPPTLDRPVDAAMLVPLVLEGPAWPGQDLELVVHREREDEAFDNPALDRWCGELVIDLPALGRVSGHLAWSMQGLRIRLEGQDATSVAAMSATAPELAQALADVALPVIALSIGRPFADNGGGDAP